MPKSSARTRICGVPKGYQYIDWIQESLSSENNMLDYFSFANTFNNTEQNTNSHYVDLLNFLSNNNQSKKLIGIANAAQAKFKNRKKSTTEPGFAKDYQEYWAGRNGQQTRQALKERQDNTIAYLNNLTCSQIEKRAEELYSENNTLPESSSSVNPLSNVLNLAKQLSTDRVGHLNILDLSSESVTTMLKDELAHSEFETIMQTQTLPPINLSAPAQSMLDKIVNSPPETGSIRQALYQLATPSNFNLIRHHDLGFMEKTVRHFMDLIDSPRNPLTQPAKERTAAINTIIFIVNELFIANNDVVELDWIENEYCMTSRSKWDGVLIKVDDKRVSVALAEFSGGCQFNATTSKEVSDINKLYQCLKLMIDKIPESIPPNVYCVRYYDNCVNFEHLYKYQDKYIRNIDCSFKCPTTARLIKSYIKKVPKMLQWKEAVVNQTLKYDDN